LQPLRWRPSVGHTPLPLNLGRGARAALAGEAGLAAAVFVEARWLRRRFRKAIGTTTVEARPRSPDDDGY